jgi:hypothetical protein
MLQGMGPGLLLLALLAQGAPTNSTADGPTDTTEQTAPASEKSRSDVDGLVVPILSFNSDVGFGFGAAGGVFFYGDKKPYAHGLSAQVFFTTRGVQSHFLNYDAPGLLGPIRFEAHLEYARDLYAPYFGPGNRSAQGAPPEQGKRYSYILTQPMVWVRFRLKLQGVPIEPYLEYRYRAVSVELYPGSVLEVRPPVGLEGGALGQFTLGALYDTRDSEADTTRGELFEVALRGADGLSGSDYTFGGLTLSGRKYVSIFTPKVVLAGRVMVDGTFGHTPFFVWPFFGGISNAEGLGGQSSVRGVPRDRYQGDWKVFGNLELRISPIHFVAFGGEMKLGVVGFVDSGRVWHVGTSDGGLDEWHSGAGGGLRLIRAEAVVRVDYGVDLNTNRKALYLAFGQLF